MEIKKDDRIVDAARLYMLKDVAEKLSMPYATLYLKKLKGELDVVTISGVDFIVEPEEGFENSISIKRYKKKGNK